MHQMSPLVVLVKWRYPDLRNERTPVATAKDAAKIERLKNLAPTPEGYVGRAFKWWTIPRADRLIASGRGECAMLARRYRVRRERLTIILTPIDTTRFRPLDRAEAELQLVNRSSNPSGSRGRPRSNSPRPAAPAG